jgi:DNA-binding GntR family transcriptional regulator
VPRPRTPIIPAQLERRVYEQLLDDIVGGAVAPGEQLVEARIAEDLGVSKTPVREALIRLQRDGLVEIEPYRGARVLQPSEQDVIEIFELRVCIEAHVARDLAERQPPEVLKRLRKSIIASRAALDRRDKRAFVKSLRDFNDALAAGCGNQRMAKVLSELRNILELIGNTSLRVPGREHRSIDEHEAIASAIERGDPEAAMRATAEHILSVQRDSLGMPLGTEHEDERTLSSRTG